MGMLSQSETLPISEIGRRLLISKPQMTHIIDKLIKLDIVERLPDKTDRRIINIKLNNNGKKELEKNQNLMRDNIRNKLSSLKERELEELSVSLRKLRDIGAKLE
jgi:DNA-binding MarR family transcriptional regulator